MAHADLAGDRARCDSVAKVRDDLAEIAHRVERLRPVDRSGEQPNTATADPALRVVLAHVEAARETLTSVHSELRDGSAR